MLRKVKKEALVKVRVQQGVFRDKLLKKYSRCCLCGVNDENLLNVSYIESQAENAYTYFVCEEKE